MQTGAATEVTREGGKVETVTRFNYRGEAGPADDPESFTKQMAERGLQVLVLPEFQGKVIERSA